MPEAVQHYQPYIVIFNFFLVAVVLIVLGKAVTARKLKEIPEGAQNVAEYILEWFIAQAKAIYPADISIIAPFIATLFLIILLSNLLAILPIPVIKIPPTSYYSGPLALSLIAVFGIIAISAKYKGILNTLKHFFWPNPIQLISELSHALSLSLRLYGNIGGEFIVALLVVEAAPYGIPLVIHALGLIPAFIQPLVFTLLTANFLASTLHGEKKEKKQVETMPAIEKETAGPVSVSTADGL